MHTSKECKLGKDNAGNEADNVDEITASMADIGIEDVVDEEEE